MSKSVAAIRFEPEEKDWIAAFAQMNGQSFSAQVRAWVLERLEDELDARDLKLAVEESAADPSDVGIGIDEFMGKYGVA
ncbi:MAG: DUF6290 family protein [Eggerthellaceae bacterium]|nr:DUF6290 family protein [Eggerthellaceae bacterium]